MKKVRKIQFANEIKEFARLREANLVGITPVDRFEGAPKGFHPKDIIPEARSVIVIGKYFPLGVLEGRSKAAVTKVFEVIFNALDHCAYELSCFVEKRGWRALSIPADAPYFSWDVTEQHGRGDLSHRHAAVLAGLGSLGKNSLLITPEFGNRVNLASIVTTIPLEGDPLFERTLCIRGCNLCIKSCPANAINEDGTVIQKECRKFHKITTLRGFTLFACWECRKVCPVQGSIIQKHRNNKGKR